MLAARSPRISAQTSAPQRNDAECHKRPNAPQQKGRAEKSDERHRRLLRARCQRPTCRRDPEQRDELAAMNHSITSSARESSVAGMSRPSVFAVLRLMTSSTHSAIPQSLQSITANSSKG
jgi:hypothetical protein